MNIEMLSLFVFVKTMDLTSMDDETCTISTSQRSLVGINVCTDCGSGREVDTPINSSVRILQNLEFVKISRHR